MDSSSPIGSSKRPQTINEASVLKSGVPSLNDLPDLIIHHILSLVPVKDAVRTCILSKKWVDVWKSISKFDFNQQLHLNRILFVEFVENMLCRNPEKIDIFSLSCDVQEDASRINSWISIAVSRKVEKLRISLYMAESFVLPQDLCLCNSLTFLQIEMVSTLKFSSSTHLSNLKVMVLRNITFSDDDSTQELFSGCPVLEELHLERCDLKNLHGISISSPKLRILTIKEPQLYKIDGNLIGCAVVILGSNLEVFHYTGQLINEYMLLNTFSLHKACIGLRVWGKRERQIAYWAMKLLLGVTCVKRLELSSECLEVFNHAKELLSQIPIFCNVTNLKLYGMIDFKNEAVPEMLQKFPSLEVLVFAEGINSELSLGTDDWSFSFLSCIKHIEVEDFGGIEDELFLIKKFMEKAVVLEKMVIHWSATVADNIDKQKKIKAQVLEFPRGSLSCSILM